ncbi:MAG: hypothetical protein P4L46_22200 [Fimbriimonas sp.]|nr:hypothetical protein [Fimbriimonas sp.]
MFSRLCSPLMAVALASLLTSAYAYSPAGEGAPNIGDLHWRLAGPFRGGRAIAVAGVPGEIEKFYFGSVGGGVWVTENAGRTWKPTFDRVPVASIGAVAVAPSDPNVIYVGTGEADMRSSIQQGSGLYKSTDSGRTWQSIGLTDTEQIGRIVIDPDNSDIAYVAALGHPYGPNTQRGVFKTTDGGKTWTRCLYKNQDTGAINLAMDPDDHSVIFACMWQTRRPPWSIYPPSNGPGSGLYKSSDSGATWTQISGHGFPASVGRIGIAISPANHNRIFTMIDSANPKLGGAYRSDDGGQTWTHTDGEPRIWGRGWYFSELAADPKNPNRVYAMNTSTYLSDDAGKTFVPIKGAPGGDDYHTMWINPNDPSHMILGSDQGVVVSVDGAKSWSSWYNQPTAQLYHVVTDNRFPYWIYGAQQDSGAIAVPSRTIHTGISAMDTRPIDVGGESGTIAPDPLHPGLLYGNGGSREQFETAWEQDLGATTYFPDTDWRSTWTLPIIVSPTDPHVFYMSHQRIFRTDNAGATWSLISPDLTRPTTPIPANLDPTTAADSDGKPRKGVVYWISPSPVRRHEIWAGTDDGLIWLTHDEGVHWTNVTPQALTPWSKVGVVDASHFNADTAYAAVDRHRLDDNRPYIYRTRDAGRHWTQITHGLPNDVWVNVVREDPKRAGLLYAGTDRAVYVSLDDGDHWYSLQLNLPAASMRDIVFGDNDVVVGTHGRSVWILDDASPLRQLRSPIASSETILFKPSPTVIFQRAGTFGFGMFDEGTPFPPEEPQGSNPAWGVNIDYSLSRSGAVTFTITDSKGRRISRFGSTDKPQVYDLRQLDVPAYWVHPKQPPAATSGSHRFVWEFHYQNDGGPMVPPGTYRIEMRSGRKTYTQSFTLLRDPRLQATDDDLRSQFEVEIAMEDEIQVANALLNRMAKALKSRDLSSAAKSRIRLAMGASPKDVGSLRYETAILSGLNGSVRSAPAAPNPQQRRALRQIRAMLARIAASVPPRT